MLPLVEDEVAEEPSEHGGGDEDEEEDPVAGVEEVKLQPRQTPEPQRRPHPAPRSLVQHKMKTLSSALCNHTANRATTTRPTKKKKKRVVLLVVATKVG
jgi:hypothetical protein